MGVSVLPRCASRRAQIDSERAAQEERQALIRQSHSTLATTRDELREMKDKLRERRQLLWQAKSMETVRQTRIILELSQIFPVQQVSHCARLYVPMATKLMCTPFRVRPRSALGVCVVLSCLEMETTLGAMRTQWPPLWATWRTLHS